MVAIISILLFGMGIMNAFYFSSSKKIEQQLKERAFYYRIKADYSHIDRNTGEVEKINFDFVALCDASVWMDPDKKTFARDNPVPSRYMKRTADDGLIIMIVPTACKSHEFPDKKDIPEDLMPFVIWYDNVNEIHNGWGYGIEDAYESPVSQLKFHGASLVRTSYEDWVDWRAETLANFKPKGFDQLPWGLSKNGSDFEYLETLIPKSVTKLNTVHDTATFACRGVTRVAIPQQIGNELNNLWPNGAPKFWTRSALDKTTKLPSEWYKHPDYPGGHYARTVLGVGYEGVRTRAGGGRMYKEKNISLYNPEIYPLIKIDYLEDNENDWNNEKTQYVIHRPEYRGFFYCGVPSHKQIKQVERLKYPKEEGLFVNQYHVGAKDNHLAISPRRFFESTDFIWEYTTISPN